MKAYTLELGNCETEQGMWSSYYERSNNPNCSEADLAAPNARIAERRTRKSAVAKYPGGLRTCTRMSTT